MEMYGAGMKLIRETILLYEIDTEVSEWNNGNHSEKSHIFSVYSLKRTSTFNKYKACLDRLLIILLINLCLKLKKLTRWGARQV